MAAQKFAIYLKYSCSSNDNDFTRCVWIFSSILSELICCFREKVADQAGFIMKREVSFDAQVDAEKTEPIKRMTPKSTPRYGLSLVV